MEKEQWKSVFEKHTYKWGPIFLTMGNILLSQILIKTIQFRHLMKSCHCFSNVILWQSSGRFNSTYFYVCKFIWHYVYSKRKIVNNWTCKINRTQSFQERHNMKWSMEVTLQQTKRSWGLTLLHEDSAMAEHCKMNNKHILNLQTLFSGNESEE